MLAKRLLAVAFVCTTLMLAILPAALALDVEGTLIEDTVWRLEDSPIIVTGDVRLDTGVTLTIEPGVQVRFDGLYQISIGGKMLAIGTPANRIVITSNRVVPGVFDWRAIRFEPNSVGAIVNDDDKYVSGSVIRNCEISYGGPVQGYDGAPFIADNYFHHLTTAVWLSGVAKTVVRDNTISHN